MSKYVVCYLGVVSALLFVTAQCCEKPTFNKVNIKASKYFTLKNEDDDINLNESFTGCITSQDEFKNALTIVIRNENVPNLYQGSVADLPWLHELAIEDSNVENVEAGAFHNLPTLVTLSLANNKIQIILDGVFNNMNIKRLLLNNNQISTISPSAFDNMPELNKIELDHNKIQQWQANWFLNTPNIHILSFTHNEIKELPAAAFQNIKSSHKSSLIGTSIFLASNKIEKINKDAFKGLKDLQFLDLDKNELSEINDEFSGMKTITTLLLSGNQIKCLSEDTLNTLPKTELTNLESNPLDCVCLKQMQDWSKKHKGNLKTYIRKIECMQERIKNTLSDLKNREYETPKI